MVRKVSAEAEKQPVYARYSTLVMKLLMREELSGRQVKILKSQPPTALTT